MNHIEPVPICHCPIALKNISVRSDARIARQEAEAEKAVTALLTPGIKFEPKRSVMITIERHFSSQVSFHADAHDSILLLALP